MRLSPATFRALIDRGAELWSDGYELHDELTFCYAYGDDTTHVLEQLDRITARLNRINGPHTVVTDA